MSKPLKLSHYSVDIYNAWHSTCGTLVTDKAGKIVACEDLYSCQGWTEENSGNPDEILDRVMAKANKVIKAGRVPDELPADKGDYIVVASVEYGGNCADILANYDEDEEDAE